MTLATGKDIVYKEEFLNVPSVVASLHDHDTYISAISNLK